METMNNFAIPTPLEDLSQVDRNSYIKSQSGRLEIINIDPVVWVLDFGRLYGETKGKVHYIIESEEDWNNLTRRKMVYTLYEVTEDFGDRKASWKHCDLSKVINNIFDLSEALNLANNAWMYGKSL